MTSPIVKTPIAISRRLLIGSRRYSGTDTLRRGAAGFGGVVTPAAADGAGAASTGCCIGSGADFGSGTYNSGRPYMRSRLSGLTSAGSVNTRVRI